MLRNIVRLHTLILVGASLGLLIAPGQILGAFEVADASFPVLSLTRVMAGIVGLVAAAVYPVPRLPAATRSQALAGLALAYTLLGVLTVSQQIAIWSSFAGVLLSAQCFLHAGAFAWLASHDRRLVATGV